MRFLGFVPDMIDDGVLLIIREIVKLEISNKV